MLYRQEALPKAICDIAWKAQLRLTSRFRQLVAPGKAKPKVATAIARELTGFIWAIAREVPRRRVSPRDRSDWSAASRPGGESSRALRTAAPAPRPCLGRGQLRDEPPSGRYPTRGYQQRQPSLERGAADQMDLTHEAARKKRAKNGTHDR